RSGAGGTRRAIGRSVAHRTRGLRWLRCSDQAVLRPRVVCASKRERSPRILPRYSSGPNRIRLQGQRQEGGELSRQRLAAPSALPQQRSPSTLGHPARHNGVWREQAGCGRCPCANPQGSSSAVPPRQLPLSTRSRSGNRRNRREGRSRSGATSCRRRGSGRGGGRWRGRPGRGRRGCRRHRTQRWGQRGGALGGSRALEHREDGDGPQREVQGREADVVSPLLPPKTLRRENPAPQSCKKLTPASSLEPTDCLR
ncbi:hypothetical protein T484DRAFT_2582462, partial [Baffinella frigidus]